MRGEMDQVKAWKDAEGSEGVNAEHPAGEVELPMSRGQVARTMALAGLVVGMSAMSVASMHGTTTAP